MTAAGARFSTKARVVVFLALLALVLAGGAWLVLRDESPPNDAHLRSYRRTVKEEENGFRLVDLKEQDVWNDGEEPDLDWSSATFDQVRATVLIEKNQTVLEKVDRCLALPDFQVEVVEFVGPYPYALAWRALGRVLAMRARLHMESGRPGDACEDGLRMVRFGRRIQSSQGSLIVYMQGTNMESSGLVSLMYAASRGDIPLDGLRCGIDVLAGERSHALWLKDALKAEYVGFSEVIDDLAEGKRVDFLKLSFLRRALFKPNETKHLLCEDIGFLVSAASLPHHERVPLDAGKYETSGLGSLTGDGKVIAEHVVFRYESILTRADLLRFQNAATLSLLALQLARAETGALPASLDEIVPRYLPSVPLDPFDGKPLRYSASKQVIYSVGTDAKDAGGLDQADPMEAFGDEAEPTLRFSAEAWDLDAMEKRKQSGESVKTKRAKEVSPPRTRP
jgi:hypothetical protein